MSTRRFLGARSPLLGVGAVVLALGLAGAVLAFRYSSQPAKTPVGRTFATAPARPAAPGTVQMTSLTPAEAAQARFTFYVPSQAQLSEATVSQASAEATAEGLYGANRILESKLVVADTPAFQAVDDYPGGTPGLHRLCWVVSLPAEFAAPGDGGPVPRAGQTAYPSVRADYLVVVIDAVTGKPLLGQMGNA